MTKSKRLKPLAKLAKNGEDTAARALGECQQRFNEQQSRLDDLKSYRHDYVMQLKNASRSGLESGAMQRYQQFLAKIDEAIALQGQLVERTRQEYEEKNKQWSAARTKHKALDKAVTRHRTSELRQRERREQRQNDERRHQQGDRGDLDPGGDEG